MEVCDKRSNLTLSPQNCRGPRILDECELAERDIQLHHPMAPTELRHRTSRPLKEACTVYQQTGQTDPKKPARFKKLDQKIKKKK